MVTIQESLRGAKGRELVTQIAQAFGTDEAQTQAALASLADELSARIQRSMLSRGGVADVVSLVTAAGAQQALANPVALASPAVSANGDQILDVLIGSKHISRGIAARTASQTGLDASTVEKLLPVAASLLIGELQRQSGPAIARVASGIQGFGGAGGSPLSMPGDPFPSSRPAYDRPGGPSVSLPSASPGRPIDGGSPLPLPGDNIPGLGRNNRYPSPETGQDDNPWSKLPDIVRRGGERVPGPDGGSLENIIRSIIGNLLGSNSGVIGTMIKLFLVRTTVSILRRALGGALGGVLGGR
jgi:uncharacterized protein YidB (DUF937 family)